MTNDEIKAWLKKNGVSRQDFGAQIGVSKSTVDNWLAGVFRIPDKKMALIEQYIERKAPRTTISADDFRTFPVLISAEDYALCEQAASASELSVSDWAAEILTAEAITFAQKEAAAVAKNSSATA